MSYPIDQLTIGDLIDVPEVQTVIDMSEVRDLDPDDPEGRVALETLSYSFVVTEDILKILSTIMGCIDRDEGRGFFIIGNYGSGKSHLLSVLGLLARYPWTRSRVFGQDPELQKLQTAVDHRRLLPVMVPLTEYSSEYSLEKIVWHAAETTAALAGVPLNLSYTQRFLELFNRYILPVHDAEFREEIKRRFEDVTWEQICRDDMAAAHTLVLQFIERDGTELPFDVTSDRSELLNTLNTSLQQNGWDGIFFIIDELSEFLKAKPDNRALNEDTRFLQFLGEASRNRPLWIAAALQETIERTGDISPAVFKKIKDRYHQRLRLSTRHLHTLISRRLIQKKHPDAEPIIREIFNRFQRAFNRIPVNHETFSNIYPVHPETLELLNQNIDLFSQHRGIVDFLSARIRGREADGIPGILEWSCQRLLTPEIIFDHFIDRFAASPQFSPYYLLFQQEFATRIPVVFPDPDERDAAFRAAKILILLAISPFQERRTVRELANMILFSALDPAIAAGETNYAFFEERIIRKLYEQVGFIQRHPGETRFDDVYAISITPGQTETLDDRIGRIKAGMDIHFRDGVTDIITTMGHGEFPLALFWNRSSVRDAVPWQNTRRRIGIRMVHCSDLDMDAMDTFRDDIRRGRLDMVLLIAFPEDPPARQLEAQKFLSRESGETLNAWSFLIPQSIDQPEMHTCLLELQACRIVIQELDGSEESDESELLKRVKERRERYLEKGRSIIVQACRNALFFTAEGRVESHSERRGDTFDAWLRSAMAPALSRRYPDHLKIAPAADCHSRVVLQMLFDRLIKPGRLTKKQATRDDALTNAIESVLVPLGLAHIRGDHWMLSGSPRQSPAARLIMDQLPVSESLEPSLADARVPAGRVWLSAHTSRYGMARPVFDLTLVILIRKGYVTAYSNGETVNLDALEMPLTGQLDRLSRGPLLPDHLKPAFKQLYELLMHRSPGEWDLDTQEQLWKKAHRQLDTWTQSIADVQNCVDQIAARFPDAVSDLRKTRGFMEQIKALQAALGEEDPVTPNWYGFLPVFAEMEAPDDFTRLMKRMKSFVSVGFAPYVNVISYLSDPRLQLPETAEFDPLRSLYNTVYKSSLLTDEIILGDGLKHCLDLFEQFLRGYTEKYVTLHQNRNESIQNQNYARILRSLEVQLFERLQSVPLIRRMCSNRRPIKTALAATRDMCALDPKPILQTSPVCRCGFSPGVPVNLPKADELLKQIRLQIQLAVEIIQSDEIRGKLETMAPLEDDDAVDATERLFALDPGDPNLITRLDNLLNAKLLHLLQQLDSIRSPRLTVRLAQLTALLDGQVMSVAQARAKILAWLHQEPDLEDSDWIRFDG